MGVLPGMGTVTFYGTPHLFILTDVYLIVQLILPLFKHDRSLFEESMKFGMLIEHDEPIILRPGATLNSHPEPSYYSSRSFHRTYHISCFVRDKRLKYGTYILYNILNTFKSKHSLKVSCEQRCVTQSLNHTQCQISQFQLIRESCFLAYILLHTYST